MMETADRLPCCTGVIVPGYDRYDVLLATEYVPNRHAVAYPMQRSQYVPKTQVRVIFNFDAPSLTQTAEIQVCEDGEHWHSTQQIDLGVNYRVDYRMVRISYIPTGTLSKAMASALEPVSHQSMETVKWDG